MLAQGWIDSEVTDQLKVGALSVLEVVYEGFPHMEILGMRCGNEEGEDREEDKGQKEEQDRKGWKNRRWIDEGPGSDQVGVVLRDAHIGAGNDEEAEGDRELPGCPEIAPIEEENDTCDRNQNRG